VSTPPAQVHEPGDFWAAPGQPGEWPGIEHLPDRRQGQGKQVSATGEEDSVRDRRGSDGSTPRKGGNRIHPRVAPWM